MTHRTPSSSRRTKWGTALLVAAAALLVLPAFAAAQVSFASDDDDLTFSRDVAPLIQQNCQICHQEGQIGPMDLITYQDVRRYARRIRDLVANREMPPYQYDSHVGVQELQNDWRMSEEDIKTIVDWVDAGAPEGDPADLPEPISYPEIGEWRFGAKYGEPDHIIKSAAWDVPANGQDLWWEPEVETGITESRCIKAIETLPSREAHGSTHHANSFFSVLNEETGEFERFGRLSEYAYGKLGEEVPLDACRVAPANSHVSWSIHYYPDGKAVADDQVTVGIWYHDEDFDAEEAYEQDLRSYALQGGDFDIPPHGKLMTQGFHTFDHPVRVDSWQPHLHLRGVGMTLEAFYPETGRREVLSSATNWNAGWNHSHIYEDGHQPLLPAGAIMILTGWYDNTADNPRNPDPDQWVGTGQRTTDEMSHAWIAITHLDEEGYERMVAERESEPITMNIGGGR